MTAAERAARSRRSQGLPETITDPAALADVARIIARSGASLTARDAA